MQECEKDTIKGSVMVDMGEGANVYSSFLANLFYRFPNV